MALESLDNVKNQRGHGLRMGRTFVAPLDGLSDVSGEPPNPMHSRTSRNSPAAACLTMSRSSAVSC